MFSSKAVAAYVVSVSCMSLIGSIARASDDLPVKLSTTLRTGAEPIESLPAHVLAPEGELSLFADFGDVRGDHVVLYLVNRTPLRLGIPTQDYDPYVKLEAWSDSREWERAQKHFSSWCGNSYFAVPLRPGSFFRFLGYYPADGVATTVRYRVYSQNAQVLEPEGSDEPVQFWEKSKESIPLFLVTNVGRGRVRVADIEAAHADGQWIALRSFPNVRDIVREPATGGSPYDRRSPAVEALGQFPTEESFALLRGFLTDGDPVVVAAALRGLAKMGLELESAEKLYQELLRGDDYGLCMHAINALMVRPITPEVIQFAKEQLTHDDLYVRVMAMSVIGSQCKADPDMKAFLNSVYDDPDPKIQSIFETVLYPTCINYNERGYKGQFRRGE